MRILLLLLCTTLLGACSCQRGPAAPAQETVIAGRPGATAATATGRASAEATARTVHTATQRAQATSDAVDTLHGYLRELGSGRHDEAGKRWAYQRSPSVDEEAGLRSLAGLQALRIDNAAPKPLDAEPVPAYLEIPVELRASMDDGQVLRFHGWYRLRHNPVTTRWELTAASVSPVIR